MHAWWRRLFFLEAVAAEQRPSDPVIRSEPCMSGNRVSGPVRQQRRPMRCMRFLGCSSAFLHLDLLPHLHQLPAQPSPACWAHRFQGGRIVDVQDLVAGQRDLELLESQRVAPHAKELLGDSIENLAYGSTQKRSLSRPAGILLHMVTCFPRKLVGSFARGEAAEMSRQPSES